LRKDSRKGDSSTKAEVEISGGGADNLTSPGDDGMVSKMKKRATSADSGK
jgi:hypothetical protein